jgi:hypothetical protein
MLASTTRYKVGFTFHFLKERNSLRIVLINSELSKTSYIYIYIYVTKNKTNSMAGVSGELYRESDRRLSAKLAPTFADRVCRVVSAADPLRQ